MRENDEDAYLDGEQIVQKYNQPTNYQKNYNNNDYQVNMQNLYGNRNQIIPDNNFGNNYHMNNMNNRNNQNNYVINNNNNNNSIYNNFNNNNQNNGVIYKNNMFYNYPKNSNYVNYNEPNNFYQKKPDINNNIQNQWLNSNYGSIGGNRFIQGNGNYNFKPQYQPYVQNNMNPFGMNINNFNDINYINFPQNRFVNNTANNQKNKYHS